jgi:ammonia channel protein AmtB
MTNGDGTSPLQSMVNKITNEAKKKDTDWQNGCAIVFLIFCVLFAVITLALTLSLSIAIIRHDPHTPWIIINGHN